MRYNLILENWKQFLSEQDMATVAPTPLNAPVTNQNQIKTYGDLQNMLQKINKDKTIKAVGDEAKNVVLDQIAGLIPGASNIKSAFGFFKAVYDAKDTQKTNTWLDRLNIDDNYTKIVDDTIENAFLQELTQLVSRENPQTALPTDFNINKKLEDWLKQKYGNRTLAGGIQEAKKKKGSGDRCTRIAKRKYDVWPSAYASGAVVKCRQGKIWKGISENATDEEIDQLLLEEINILEEEWSDKYKRSINCKNPKGFSQRAHCQGRKKKNEEIDLGEIEIIEEDLDEAKKKAYKPNFSKEKEQGLHGWFARNKGKGWVNCRTGGPCGRDSADSGGKYPACRPTKAQCKSAGKGPLRKKKSSKPISWTKKKNKD